MGNQQNPQDSKTPAKGGGNQSSQKEQNSKPGNKGGQDQMQQRTGGDSGGDHNTGSHSNDQERAGDSGQKSHE
jgi:hypothetical protein